MNQHVAGHVILLGLLAILTVPVHPAPLEGPFWADVSATASLVAAITGLEISAVLDGEATVGGEAVSDGRFLRLSATGPCRGVGTWTLATSTIEAWATLDAIGETDDGRACSVRSLFYAYEENILGLLDGSVFVGTQVTQIEIDGEATTFVGTFTGTVTGSTEPGAEPMTIRLVGRGGFRLVGNPGPFPDAIPLDRPTLPDETREEIVALFDVGASDAGVPIEGD